MDIEGDVEMEEEVKEEYVPGVEWIYVDVYSYKKVQIKK